MKKTVCLKTSKFTTTIPVIHILFVFILLGGWINSFAQELPRWKIDNSGAIVWKTDNRLPHSDHIEMSGLKLSAVIHYGVNSEGGYTIQRTIVWPMLRIIPNDTYGSFIRNFNWDIFNSINVNGSPIQNEKVTEISHNGLMVVKSMVGGELECTRVLFPSTTKPVFNEQYQILNKSSNVITVEIPDYKNTFYTDPDKGVAGSYAVTACSVGGGVYKLKPNEAVTFGAQFYAYKKSENIDLGQIADEKIERENLVKLWWKNLVLETPDPILNKAFAFAKIRAAESIYQTKGGLMHSPGGETYYAAIWANDQAEYIGPFFPYLGYETGNKASLNAYLHYARFMNPEYKPIPSSIIAEGTDIWNGAGDRGDAAMIAYGASRYALVKGNLDEAKQLWPLIEWCLEYCKRKLNDKGVVTSNCDELEGRFPAGNANLCTSSLYYDALHSAAMLGKDLGKPAAQLLSYENEAAALKIAIGNYFGCKVEGFDTYRYYKENDVLRAWICMPLTVGINDRKQGTIDALFSPRLWTADGLASQAGDKTFWDRSTLYALRGVFACGETEKAYPFLKYYSERRLLGEHVPYPVEAYPEGGQRHLSAESGLYCRIFSEGVFGIRPTGLHSFVFTPRLPKEWDHMALKKIMAFGKEFDLVVERNKKGLKTMVVEKGKILYNKIIKEGKTVRIEF